MSTVTTFFDQYSLSSDTWEWAGQLVSEFLEFGHYTFRDESDSQYFLDMNKGRIALTELPDAPIKEELMAYCMGPSFVHPKLSSPIDKEIPMIPNPEKTEYANLALSLIVTFYILLPFRRGRNGALA